MRTTPIDKKKRASVTKPKINRLTRNKIEINTSRDTVDPGGFWDPKRPRGLTQSKSLVLPGL